MSRLVSLPPFIAMILVLHCNGYLDALSAENIARNDLILHQSDVHFANMTVIFMLHDICAIWNGCVG